MRALVERVCAVVVYIPSSAVAAAGAELVRGENCENRARTHARLSWTLSLSFRCCADCVVRFTTTSGVVCCCFCVSTYLDHRRMACQLNARGNRQT